MRQIYKMTDNLKKVNAVIEQVNSVIIGKNDVVKKLMATIIAGGHILLEDVPGVGKTTMAVAFSRAMNLNENRMQFTPDVLPSDVVGFSVPGVNGEFEYRPGAIMCNLFLADEINRTSPKTQSALLEVMEEGNVTVDSVTRKVPEPFVVIATQNPAGSAGTQLLPESQLDRFMVRLSIGYPDIESEANMLRGKINNVSVNTIENIIGADTLLEIKKEVEQVYVSDEIIDFISKIAFLTRTNSYIKLGLSPRGTVALLTMSKAIAYINSRDYVIPEDIRECAKDVMSHRIIISTKAKVENYKVEDVIDSILGSIETPTFKK